jgi:PPK2 family polyphosphate:nucleotide phosphotransferase
MSDSGDLRDKLRVRPGTKVDLGKLDPAETYEWNKAAAEPATEKLLARMSELQDRIWAEQKHALLVVLQGIDAAGKDGTISKVMTAFNPQGCTVSDFKIPSAEEMAHDFLWRIHARVPGKGSVGIFNRSHYEQVLVVRVHEIEPREVWSRHYEHIRDFEKLLSDTGTTIVKFFLQIDKDEQRQRFQARYDDPAKRWKFSMADLEERRHWDEYMRAYADALSETSTDEAPWYVIPANRNWMRNLAVASILAETMGELNPAYPPEPALPKNLKIE